MTTKRCNINKP